MTKADLFALAAALLLALLPAVQIAAAAREGSAPPRCAPDDMLPNAKLILFGELHGSKEAPDLIGQLACAIARKQAVAVGLEIPATDQALIDAFLASAGTPADRRRPTRSEFWKSSRDGRSSAAMLSLIDQVRKISKQSGNIDLFAFDRRSGHLTDGSAELANGIRQYQRRYPDRRVIALMGKAHASQSSRQVNGKTEPSAASLLQDPLTILLIHPAGSAWNCIGLECGIHTVAATRYTEPSGLNSKSRYPGYDYSGA